MAVTVERKLPVTPEQITLLNECERLTQLAIARTDLVLATIIAGHGIRGATFKGLEPGDPAHLIVTVPDTASQTLE